MKSYATELSGLAKFTNILQQKKNNFGQSDSLIMCVFLKRLQISKARMKQTVKLGKVYLLCCTGNGVRAPHYVQIQQWRIKSGGIKGKHNLW